LSFAFSARSCALLAAHSIISLHLSAATSTFFTASSATVFAWSAADSIIFSPLAVAFCTFPIASFASHCALSVAH
jgi:hypothetical protein